MIKTVDGDSADAAPAYILTSGHCARAWMPNEVLVDLPNDGMSVVFGYFADTLAQQATFKTRKIDYSSMKGSDIAVVELDVTYGGLLSKGFSPMAISTRKPLLDEPIVVVGAPTDGFPPGESYLRLAACRMGEQVDLLIEHHWHFFDSYRNQCADVRGGSSGSPVVSREEGTILALLNTGTEDGYFDCSINRPWEVGEHGHTVLEDTNYAVPVLGIDRCFDSKGRFELSQPKCPLDNGEQPALDGYPPTVINPFFDRLGGNSLETQTNWNTTVSGTSHYRYKTGTESQIDCRDSEGYGAVMNAIDSSLISEGIPEVEGRYFLCVVGDNSPAADTSWQDPRYATMVHVWLDTTPFSCQHTLIGFISPYHAVRGKDRVPSGFDPVNWAGCDFKDNIEMITIELWRGGKKAFEQTVARDTPSKQVNFPLPGDKFAVVSPDMETGRYERVIRATTTEGQEIELKFDTIWVVVADGSPAREVKRALAARLNVFPEMLGLLIYEPLEWSDTSLGCPEPGMTYAQVTTPGFRLVFVNWKEADQRYEYHTNADGSILAFCGSVD